MVLAKNIALVFAFVVFQQSQVLQAQDRQVDSLLTNHWSWYLQQNPVFAGQLGDRSGDGKLRNASVANQSQAAAKLKEFLAEGRAIDQSGLSQNAELNLRIFIKFLEDEIAEFEHEAHLVPITNRWGFHIYFAELYKRLPFKNEKDYESYIGRLEAFSEYAAEHMELLSLGVEKGRCDTG